MHEIERLSRTNDHPWRDPFPWYRQMRQTAPVWYDTSSGVWNVFRYADVQRVLQDHPTFSSDLSGERPLAQRDALQASVISTDPPRHQRLRALVSKAFSPRSVSDLAPRIQAITDLLLDAVADRDQIDVVADLAYPLPVMVIAELLGVPTEDRATFKRWSDAIVGGNGRLGQAEGEVAAYFARIVEQRRAQPRYDLISSLLRAEVDGQRLTPVEILGFCVLLLVAGNETTTNLIGNAVRCLAEHPDALATVQSDPALLPTAIEEVLRYDAPVQALPTRVARVDVELGDQRIREGQQVVSWIGSANRDEEVFPDADRFVVDRSPNRHLAFGAGVHFCLGAPLARLEAKIALAAFLARYPRFVVVEEAVTWTTSPIVFGPTSLPIQRS